MDFADACWTTLQRAVSSLSPSGTFDSEGEQLKVITALLARESRSGPGETSACDRLDNGENSVEVGRRQRQGVLGLDDSQTGQNPAPSADRGASDQRADPASGRSF